MDTTGDPKGQILGAAGCWPEGRVSPAWGWSNGLADVVAPGHCTWRLWRRHGGAAVREAARAACAMLSERQAGDSLSAAARWPWLPSAPAGQARGRLVCV